MAWGRRKRLMGSSLPRALNRQKERERELRTAEQHAGHDHRLVE